MAMQEVHGVQRVLDARLQAYEAQCVTLVAPESAEDAKHYLYESLKYDVPTSVVLVLLALRWCLNHTIEEVEEGFVFDLAVVDVLDVSDTWEWVPYQNEQQGVTYESSKQEGERVRREKRESFDTWSRDDCLAVHEWMCLAATWPFVQRDYRDRLKAATEYWRTRAGGSG